MHASRSDDRISPYIYMRWSMRILVVTPWNPMYICFFCVEVGLLYHCDDLLLEGGFYILINIVEPLRLLVYLVCVGFHCCCVAVPMLCIWNWIRRSCVCRSGQVRIHCCVHNQTNVAISPPPPTHWCMHGGCIHIQLPPTKEAPRSELLS